MSFKKYRKGVIFAESYWNVDLKRNLYLFKDCVGIVFSNKLNIRLKLKNNTIEMYKLNLKILHLIIYFGCSSAIAQNLKVSETKFDSVRNATEELSIYFPDSALGSALLLIQMAKASNIEQQYSKALSTSAKIKIKAGLIDEAIIDNQNSTSINERLNNQQEIAKNYSIEGQINHYKANYVEATKFYLKSLSLIYTCGVLVVNNSFIY